MPVEHKIDTVKNLITTIWLGEAADNELIKALSDYQKSIKSQPDYISYNEIVDFSNVSKFKISTEGIRKLVQIAAQTDVRGKRTKLAIIVSKPVAFGLARMYEVYRSLQPNVVKEVRTFMQYDDALEWIQRK